MDNINVDVEEVVVDDGGINNPDVVLLPGLQVALSPNIIDISDSVSVSSGSDIFEVASDEENAAIVEDSDSESNDATRDSPAPSVTHPTTSSPPLPQLPELLREPAPASQLTLLPIPLLPQQPAPAPANQLTPPQIPVVPQQPAPTNQLPEATQPTSPRQQSQDTLVSTDAGTDQRHPREEPPNLVQHPPTEVAVAVTSPPSTLSRTQNTVLNESVGEFRSPKRRKHNSPVKTAKAESDDDCDCCPICFEPWTTSGNHRLASLRCGHLFGQSCIDKWLKGQGGKCPQCNAKAKRQDIRVLYTKSISAVDTTERDRALADLDKEKECRRKAELEAAHSRLQYQLCVEECNRLRQDLTSCRTQLQQLRSQMSGQTALSQTLGGASQSVTATSGHKFIPDRTVKIWEGGQCRVLAYSSSLAALMVSQPSSSSLFPGYGIKKLSSMDFKTAQYMTIHSKPIRDICFHPTVDNGILLSCGLDKTAKMTSIMSNTVVQTYHTPMPVWSCEWNIDDSNYFYTGLINGSVLEFDIRNTQTHTQQLNTEGTNSPVAALKYIPRDHNAAFRPGGLVVGQLHRTSFFERKGEEQPRLNFLPLEGSLTSLSFDLHTRHLLASFRPTTKHSMVRHQLCEMSCSNISEDPTVMDNLCSCNIIHTFQGGRTQSILSKSALVPNPADLDSLLVCAGDETSNSIRVWDCRRGEQVQRISTGAFVLDFATFAINNQHFLVALTEKMLKVHKWC